MKHKNSFLLTVATVIIIGGLAVSASKVSAQDSLTEARPMSSLAQKIAEKFGLNKDEVQSIFDQQRAEMQAQRKAQFEKKLSELVSSGKITEAQKQLLLNKHAELEKKHEANRDLMRTKTFAERKAIMDAERTALEQWATQNNINKEYLFLVHGGGPGTKGMRRMHDEFEPSSVRNK